MALKSSLFGTVAVVAVVVGGANPAWSQTAGTQAATPAAKAAKKASARKQGRKQPNAKAAATADAQASNDTGRLEGDIVVTGLRESLKTARAAKRNAAQIVDVVLAQDIGKLPDRNVPEVLARIPGIQLERDRGEGGTVRIRGLTGALTTVNGSPSFSAGDRTTYLNDISSELVAAVEVFKSRTPDQVEGSQTGVINLTLRRPFDFTNGATYVLNMRGDYSDQVKKVNPSGSALVNYVTDTNIGRMGFMVNGTYNRIQYNEAIRFNGAPTLLNDPRQLVDPTTLPNNIFIPGVVGFSGPNGFSRRAAVQGSAQWQPTDKLRLIVEGGINDQRMLWADNQFNVETFGAGQQLSNVVINPDGISAASLSVDGITAVGPERQSARHRTKGYNARGTVEFRSEQVDINASVNYNYSNNRSDNILTRLRLNQSPSFDVVFDSVRDPKGGSDITFRGMDLLDPANYRYIFGFQQGWIYTKSGEIESKVDLTLRTFNNTVDRFRFGFRHALRDYSSGAGGRNYNNLNIPISALPDYKLVAVGPQFPSGSAAPNANWLIGDAASIRNSWTAIRAILTPTIPEFANYYPALDPLSNFTGTDSSIAAYGMFHYNVNLIFPIEGDIGARVVNTLTNIESTQQVSRRVLVNGVSTIVNTLERIRPRGNYLDALPSVNAIVHFTPKLQLRLAYTYDVGRPSVYQINPRINLNVQNEAAPTATAGNPDLGPVKSTKYDASLEWYFGPTGLASVAVWQWNQQGVIQNRTTVEFLPETTSPVLVNRPYNLGRGRHRGIEGQVSTFFTFLPGILKSFGASANGTLNITKLEFPIFAADGTITSYADAPYLEVSKYMFNAAAFFERKGLNLRIAYNWRSRAQRRLNFSSPYLVEFWDPVERLDASINYDVTKNIQISVQADNLTKNGKVSYWGTYDFPRDIRVFARNFSSSVRFRF